MVFTFTEDFERKVEKNTAIRGEPVETAIVCLENENMDGSLLFPYLPNTTKIYDLVILLSFLSGRRVYLESDIERHHTSRYLDRVVGKDYFLSRQDFWRNVHILESSRASMPLYNIIQACSSPDLIGMAAYSNSALDELTTSWCKKNEKTRYKNADLIKKIKTKAESYIESSLSNKIFIRFLSLLNENKVDKEIVQDIKARLTQANQPSALYKLKLFLRAHKLFPLGEDTSAHDRLKLMNQLRNRIAHSGDIPRDENLSFEKNAQIAGTIVILVVDISRIYITKNLLKTYDSSTEKAERDVKEFFERGEFRGQRVFDETYIDYMNRIEKEWIEDGYQSDFLQ